MPDTARYAFNFPAPYKKLSPHGSALPSIFVRTCPSLIVGCSDKMSAATPDTCGVAADVPLKLIVKRLLIGRGRLVGMHRARGIQGMRRYSIVCACRQNKEKSRAGCQASRDPISASSRMHMPSFVGARYNHTTLGVAGTRCRHGDDHPPTGQALLANARPIWMAFGQNCSCAEGISTAGFSGSADLRARDAIGAPPRQSQDPF